MSTCRDLVDALFSYETPKIVQIKNISIGITSRLIQLIIIAYIIGYVLVFKKGYQDFSEVESSVTTKVKGIVFTNYSDDEFNSKILHPEWYRRIWDVADFVVPPSENGATFIATNIIITKNQTQGKCPEDPSVVGAKCTKENNTCIAGKEFATGNGVMTGNCVNHPVYNVSTCEIYAWCPTEVDALPLKNGTVLLEASKDFTVLIKNFVDFPKFANAKRRNIKDTSNSSYLKDCLYDPYNHPDCPIFRLGDIVRWSGQSDYDMAARKGGIISVIIKWDCNLDFDKSNCFPTYDFSRLDDPDAKLAPGWNFRYANYFNDNTRTLYKMFGIRLSINVVGQAGKFAVVPLLQNVGAGLGLLALQVVICDIIVLHLVRKRYYFKSKKYEAVNPDCDDSTVPEIAIIDAQMQATENGVLSGDGYQRIK